MSGLWFIVWTSTVDEHFQTSTVENQTSKAAEMCPWKTLASGGVGPVNARN